MTLIIPLLILLPLFVGIGMFLAGTKAESLVGLALGASGLVLALSLLLLFQVCGAAVPDSATNGATIIARVGYAPDWLHIRLPVSVGEHRVYWHLQFGADGIGALLVLLTGIVGFVTMIMATHQIRERLVSYLALILITQSMLLGVFLSMDLLSFYLFFEAVLLPIILLMNGWGNKAESLKASRKFLLYTLVGSVPMVIGLIGIVSQSATPVRPSTVSLEVLSAIAKESQLAAINASPDDALNSVSILASKDQWIVWILLLGFGIKLAILPLHTWLPTTYAVAHPNTTALIASVVAKLGVFGIIRIVIPLTPLALSTYAQMLFGGLGAVAIVYGALVALSQSDMRKVLAYSSISHVGFITLGLMSMNSEGLSGAAIQMFNHGIITCSMFLILAMLEQRRGPVSLDDEDCGLASIYPKLAVMMVFFTLAGAGLPGLNGFVGELLATAGMIRVSGLFTAIAVLGTVLGAWYGLRIVQRVLFGSNGEGKSKVRAQATGDLKAIEFAPLLALASICLFIGVRPQDSMDLIENDIKRIVSVSEPSAKAVHPEIDQLAQTQP
ncbi:MAG: NADH-quinone oxidoreductase subunit M [Planctomycetota bacterium]|nr:NADH-quinone oxidoreductase subunit M [Planctomycetota bacterium]